MHVVPKFPCIHSNFQSISYIQKKHYWNVGTKVGATWQTNSLILDLICMAYNDDFFLKGEWQNIVILLPGFNCIVFELDLTQGSWVVCGSQEPISHENKWNTWHSWKTTYVILELINIKRDYNLLQFQPRLSL